MSIIHQNSVNLPTHDVSYSKQRVDLCGAFVFFPQSSLR